MSEAVAAEAKVIKSAPLVWKAGTPGSRPDITEAVGSDLSPNLGAGFMRIEGGRLLRPGAVDEVIYVVSGSMKLEFDDGEVQTANEGDVVWLPKGASPTFVWDEPCLMFYAIYPTVW